MTPDFRRRQLWPGQTIGRSLGRDGTNTDEPLFVSSLTSHLAPLSIQPEMSLPTNWPPAQSPADESALLHLATDYALSHGLVLRPQPTTAGSSPSQTSVIHAPYALFPSPFPRRLFSQALELQPLYNALYAHAATDDGFLREVVGGAVSKVDEFQGRLFDIWETVKREGVKQVS